MNFVFIDENTGIVTQTFTADGIDTDEVIKLNTIPGRIVMQTDLLIPEGAIYNNDDIESFNTDNLILRENNVLPVSTKEDIQIFIDNRLKEIQSEIIKVDDNVDIRDTKV